MKQKNKCRNGIHIRPEKGITLIALIITIIVMLILVAVTITVSLNGGLFNYARKAAKGTNEAMTNEQKLASGIIDIDGKQTTIDDIVGLAVSDDWYGITEELTLEEGKTEYHITSCAELKKFANTVNAGNDFAGITIYLDKNLDLKGNENKQWTPIGNNDNPFNGTFDGQNHFISGIYIDTVEDGTYGLFGTIRGNAIIENLGVTNGYIKGNMVVGGMVGSMEGNGYLRECYNTSTIIGTANTGGIVGYINGTIENCYNIGKITTTSGDGAGGIAGNAAFGTIKECYNFGIIRSLTAFAGGIVGWSEERELIIENCYNLGIVEGNTRAGGIIGELHDGGYIKNGYNLGSITGTIVGEITGMTLSPITNCYFLSGTGNNAVGENPDNVTVDATAKSSDEMKADSFVTLLNNGGTAWKKDTKNINNGYPILSWQ